MPAHSSTDNSTKEPLRRFYPSQDEVREPFPVVMPPVASVGQPVVHRKKSGDAAYLAHRHPFLLQRLYEATDSFLDAYPKKSFLYDAYPDYLSLQWMRDRLLRENSELTQAFLQEGCPIVWLNHLTDTVVSELLARRRRF